MSWPIPDFTKIEYPKPISLRVWLPTLVAIASCTATSVVLVWPHGKPTNTYPFWGALIGAPLVACALTFGVRWYFWRREQTDAELAEEEQHRLRGLWRGWGRRHLTVVDVAAFPAATTKIEEFSGSKIDLPSQNERSITFRWATGLVPSFRRARLLRLVARRFAHDLRARKEVFVTLMLDDTSLGQAKHWKESIAKIFGRFAPGVTFHVEAQPATGSGKWITQLANRIEPAMRLVIAAQLWEGKKDKPEFSEGAAAFLIDPSATKAGAIWRPMASASDDLKIGLGQIEQYQMSPERLKQVWVAGSDAAESTAIRSALTPVATDMPTERLLDTPLGNPGPASGWIAMAIAMEAMRGAEPQLVAWREPESESLYLCAISPVPQKETTV